MKFSIRDLLLVTVIVALAVGWWVDRSWLNEEMWRWKARSENLEVVYNREKEELERIRLRLTDSMPNSSAPAPKLPTD